MQDRGFTPNLEKVCEKLDENLYNLLEDLKIYLYQSKKNSNYPLLEDDFKVIMPEKKTFKDYSLSKKYLDRLEIENHLRSCSTEHINR